MSLVLLVSSHRLVFPETSTSCSFLESTGVFPLFCPFSLCPLVFSLFLSFPLKRQQIYQVILDSFLFKLTLFYFSSSGIFKSTCYIDVRWFPFDVQRCDLKFGSWTYGGWSLDLQMIEADVTGYIANGEWDLVGKGSHQRAKVKTSASVSTDVSMPGGKL